MRRRRGDDRGSVAIELVAAVPIMVLVTIVLVQGWLMMSAVESTTRAARDGARAAAQQADAEAAARAGLPGWVDVDGITTSSGGGCAGVCTRVAVRIPFGVPGFLQVGSVPVVRSADFPRSDG